MDTETTQAPAAVRTFSIRLSSTPRGARLARRAAVGQLHAWGVPFEPAQHIVAELASNAVRHGHVPGRDFRLTLRLTAGGVLRVEVTDTCTERLPRPPGPVAPDAESGRGLLLVEALATRWGTEVGPAPGKTVWAEVGDG
ncbi:ATP-binding protein [Streptomyces flavofungini]|uniref:ATP-binding protein n=1 Tax=Streptomyces flavofungini TaxID=68200 RepID=A0ABS0XFM7_9ACTN|nr:ATP-binding protein [Streptomyces flavofungini]MBJ3812036.1 ATP-binding protein [Streptomyces flavofungini]GHC44679.1 ATP-binding protein [Streptomyces flavofungini]